MFTRVFYSANLVCFLTVTAVHCCPSGYTETSGQCLTFSSSGLGWTAAGQACNNLQGHLVTVSNASDNTAVVNFRKSQAQQGDPVWLGMRFQTGSGWQWYDGKSVTWSSWKTATAPAGTWGASSCGILETTGSVVTWTEWNCDMPLFYICQYTEPVASHSNQTQVQNKWRKFANKSRYSGTGKLSTVTSPSRIQCAAKCMRTEMCDAIGYRGDGNLCHMIAGGISANQITTSDGDEVWVKRE